LPISEPLPPLTLVLGGARAGKTAHAMRLAAGGVYIATAEAGDAEMAARIQRHRAERGPGWRTVEAPLALAAAIREAGVGDAPVLVDCLTLWLSNLLHAGHDPEAETSALLAACTQSTAPLVLVSNEVGLGIVPENALARTFRDAAGRLHQRIAERADRVILVAAGLPLTLKGG
jgi:adenosylcobinamide kinase/adenosylcobinamide-phosphate guanylyltransferase